jgi:2-hydroxychromene-2-carboxylate isomerase
MVRLARDFQLTLKPPPALDTDWARAHAAYLGVERGQPERAEAFMLEMFRARFSLGLDVALPEVIAAAATRAGADPALANETAKSPELQHEVAGNLERAQRTDRIFGAPSFVLGDQLFWGHDRIHHLRRALIEARAVA